MALQNLTLKPVNTEWTQERIKKTLYPLLEDIEASHTLSLMGKSYYYLFYKYDFFTKKNCVGFYSKRFMITEIGLSCSALFSLSSANGASQTESVCQQNKNESPAAYTTLIIKGTPQNRVWALFKNNFQISRRFFSGCFITLYRNHSEWTYILLKSYSIENLAHKHQAKKFDLQGEGHETTTCGQIVENQLTGENEKTGILWKKTSSYGRISSLN